MQDHFGDDLFKKNEIFYSKKRRGRSMDQMFWRKLG
jgi:hypothetical protein